LADWLVAMTENGRQRLARASCSENGFNTYFPLFRERRMVRGRKALILSYLFGRYFFVEFAPEWYRLKATLGVDDVLSREERPVLLREAIVDEIRSREDSDGVITLRRGFKRGQRVQVKAGPLKGLVGEFERLGNSDREVVFLSMLGQMTRVEFAAGSLAAAF
jgi:transcriptional antiterminator RfaH